MSTTINPIIAASAVLQADRDTQLATRKSRWKIQSFLYGLIVPLLEELQHDNTVKLRFYQSGTSIKAPPQTLLEWCSNYYLKTATLHPEPTNLEDYIAFPFEVWMLMLGDSQHTQVSLSIWATGAEPGRANGQDKGCPYPHYEVRTLVERHRFTDPAIAIAKFAQLVVNAGAV